MRSVFCLLLLPVAVFAQSVGDTAQQVETALGRPKSQRNTAHGQICIYGNGTKIKFENGVVREVLARSAAADPVAPAANAGSAGGAPEAAGAGMLHKSVLGGCQGALVRAGGVRADAQPLMQKRYLFVYFSAHWCPPCRRFTPYLVEFYNEHFKIGDFDLLFVSADQDQGAMDTYMRETKMPWAGIKLGHPTIDTLNLRYGVNGIPCLVLLNEKDEVIASSYKGGKYLGPQVALEKYSALHEK